MIDDFIIHRLLKLNSSERGLLMENNLSLQNVFLDILKDFYNTFNIESFPVNIAIVNDLFKGYSDLRPDHVAKQPYKMNILKEYNGTTVPPKVFSDVFTILLDANYVKESIENNNANWIGTLVHEATHVNDFIQFAKNTEVVDYDMILDTGKYRMFHLWTEFNAKAKGYYFIRKYTFENMNDENQLPYIFETELPFQIKNFFEVYHATNDGDIQMYNSVHFIGRLYILQKLFPKQFTDKVMHQLFDQNTWMYELYVFLSSHTELEKAYKDFEQMNAILKMNFQGL